MLRYLTVALAVFVAIESASADEFKLTGFMTDLLSMMEKGMKEKAHEIVKEKISKSKFTHMTEDLTRAIAKAADSEECSTTVQEAQDLLKSSQEKFQESMKTCSGHCKNYIAEAVQTIVADLQAADAAGAQQLAACGDDSCKLQVTEQTNESLMKVYKDSIPSIMASVQQMRTTGPQTFAAMTKCMIQENSENLRKIFDSLQSLRACQG